jgi:RNA polymerase sigma-70 factor (ECF subfamily)
VESFPTDRAQIVLEILDELRAGASDDAAFRRLVEIYYRPVYHFFARRGLSPDECLDLTQETFLGIYTGVRSFRQEAGFDTWLWKIATNAYLKRRRRGATAKRAGLEIPLETRESSQAPISGVSGSSASERVSQKSGLPPRESSPPGPGDGGEGPSNEVRAPTLLR